MPVPPDIADLDRRDELAGFRERFALPDGVIYLDGNSLGALPRAVPARLAQVAEAEWGRSLIRAWNEHGWIDLAAKVGGKIARLIGAGPDEVIAADSTSVNLFKLIAGALRLRPDRKTVVTEAGNFPTDTYMIEGVLAGLGDARPVSVPAEDLARAIGPDTALVVLTHVHYKSGAIHDLPGITALAHEAGALMLWDLSHSAGAVEVDLSASGADLAVGCGYKYLNGGPGAPAWLYVARRHHAALGSPLSGWFGHAAPFDFEERYRPADGIRRFLCGTPAIIGLSALDAALDIFAEVEMSRLRRKARALGDVFIEAVERAGHGLALVGPRDSARRGNQVAFRHEEGYAIMQAMIAAGVIGDFRAPDIMRFGFAPLYLSYAEVWTAAERLAAILRDQIWRDPAFRRRAAVT